MSPIQFRCIRCQHPIEAPEDAVGRKMYCPACYLELRVPAESTIRDVDPSQLYTADEVPLDVRDMKDRQSLVSVRCPVCHTNISVGREQAGTEVVCPECETKVSVPKDIGDKIDRAVGRHASESITTEETYGVHTTDQPAMAEGSRLIPVNCKLCGTRMYATEDQVGQELTCPDCETKTVVPPQPKAVPKPPPLPASTGTAFEGSSTFGVTGEPPVAGETGTGPLVPVVCKLCHTRMYARESEIGGFKTCPDCGVQTEIKAVPKEQMYQPEPDTGDGYGVSEPTEPRPRPFIRTLTDYRYVEGSLDKELYDGEQPPPDGDHFEGHAWDAEGKRTQYVDDLSAEELAHRRALRMAGFSEDGYTVQPMQRTPLPPHPFWTRLFTCFKSGYLWMRIAVSLLLTVAGYFVGSLLPGLFFVVSVPFGLFTTVIAIGLMVNTLHSLFLWTASGNDLPTPDDWMDYRFLDSTMFALWLFFVAVLGSAPGYLLYTVFSPDPQAELEVSKFLLCAIPSVWIFFPILFLSSMESGSYFMLLARETCLSLLYRTGVWLRFYVLTALLGAVFALCVFELSFVVKNPFGFLFSVLPLFMFLTLLYFRLLGRLGWTLEEQARQDTEDEEESE